MFKQDVQIKENKIYKALLFVKLLSLLFCSMVIFGNEYLSMKEFSEIFLGWNVLRMSIYAGMFFLMYHVFQYLSISTNNTNGISKQIINIAEVILTVSFFSILIFISGRHASPYKFLFLFIIITSTIQFEMYYGISVAIISSAIILTIDLIGYPTNGVNPYFENDLILVGVFILTAWLLGYYVKHEKEHQQYLMRLVYTDDLTELYKHSYFQEALAKQFENAENKKEPISIILIDVDNFKEYNDIHGHQAGDEVLKKLARIFTSSVRENDIVARYGGEEFAILLPNTDEQQAAAIAEEIRKKVEHTVFYNHQSQSCGQVTVSMGVSCYPNKAKDKREFIESVDEALCKAKHLNKNRVEIFSSVLQDLKKEIGEGHIDLVSSLKTLIGIINSKDRYTYGHLERVVIFCQMMAEYLGLSEHERKVLRYAAYLHDLGKVETPKEILNKTMPLSEEEWNILKQHPESGVLILRPVEELSEVIPVILHHHERYDGTGYPHGLKGDEIPYLARILSIADSFDTMTSNRPYQLRCSYDEAVKELERCSGSQFDPEIVQAFVEVVKLNKKNLDRLK